MIDSLSFCLLTKCLSGILLANIGSGGKMASTFFNKEGGGHYSELSNCGSATGIYFAKKSFRHALI